MRGCCSVFQLEPVPVCVLQRVAVVCRSAHTGIQDAKEALRMRAPSLLDSASKCDQKWKTVKKSERETNREIEGKKRVQKRRSVRENLIL